MLIIFLVLGFELFKLVSLIISQDITILSILYSLSSILVFVAAILYLVDKNENIAFLILIIGSVLYIIVLMQSSLAYLTYRNLLYIVCTLFLVFILLKKMFVNDNKIVVRLVYAFNKINWMNNYRMSKVLYKSGNTDSAFYYAERTQQFGAPQIYCDWLFGLYHYKKGNYIKAIEYLTRATKDNITAKEMVYYLADSLFQLKQFSATINILKESLNAGINDYDQLFLLGVTYKSVNDFQNGIIIYTRMIESYPNDSAIFYNRGELYDLVNDYEKAYNDFLSASNCLNPDPKSFIALGIYYYEQNQPNEAIKKFDKGISLDSSLIDFIPATLRNKYK